MPALHGSAALAPSLQYEPGVHGLHVCWPSWSWKLPAAHLEHVPMPAVGATVPGLHLVCAVLPVDA